MNEPGFSHIPEGGGGSDKTAKVIGLVGLLLVVVIVVVSVVADWAGK